MVQVGCVDVGVSDVKGRPIRLRQSEVCLGQGDGSIPSRPVFATPAWRRPASVSETRGPRTSRRRATASGLGSRGGGRRVCPGALRRLDAWLDGRWLQDATLAAYLAALTSLRRIPDEEEPRE